MSLESDFFRRMSVDFERLSDFGFIKNQNGFSYCETFMDGEFRANITVDTDGKVSGKVYDLNADEEYLPVHIETRTGAYVGAVRDAYMEILEKIAGSCFKRLLFIYPQSNRIADLIFEKYNENPDFPFAKDSNSGVFRYPVNRKWYGIIMAIKRGTIEKDKTDNDEIIEIINLKADESKRDKLLNINGIYPAYHMNHEKWISVVLDDTVNDGLLMRLIDESRNFAVGKRGESAGNEQYASWIIPANPKFYDIESAFAESDISLWKQSSKINAGDIVYMYVAAPVSAVRYKCVVIEADIPYEYKDKNVSMSYVMKIKKIQEYNSSSFSFAKLNELGIKTVRGPRIAPAEFLEEIEKLP